jgi:hypothetical protein
MIRDAITALRDAAGHDIVGWLAPGLTETRETPDLLAEAASLLQTGWWTISVHAARRKGRADHALQRRAE